MPTVLIVEDEFAIADLLELVLVDEGYDVVIVANGRQALDKLAEIPKPDLVISDFMMPVLSGAGMLEAMRQNDAQRDIPCILMSSMPEPNVRKQVEGYAAFIRKPFRLAEIVTLVTEIINKTRQGQKEPPAA